MAFLVLPILNHNSVITIQVDEEDVEKVRNYLMYWGINSKGDIFTVVNTKGYTEKVYLSQLIMGGDIDKQYSFFNFNNRDFRKENLV